MEDTMTRHKLESSDYEHPLDREALAMLKKIPLLDKLVAAYVELTMKMNLKVEHDGNFVRVSEKICPRVYRLYRTALERLDMPAEYPVYIMQAWEYNAYTMGVKNPLITLHSYVVNDFTDDELLFIIGHEMGHIKSEHLLYYQMSSMINSLISSLGPIGQTAASGIAIALMEWQRKSELTADRAGFIANQNREACYTALAKLMGLPEHLEEYNITQDTIVEQAEDFTTVDDTLFKKALYIVMTMWQSHPWGAGRIRELKGWKF